MTVLAVTTAVWMFILVPLILIWALGIVDIVRRDLSRSATAAWILIVVLLPVVGTVTYFLMRKPTAKEIERAQEGTAEQRRSGLPRL